MKHLLLLSVTTLLSHPRRFVLLILNFVFGTIFELFLNSLLSARIEPNIPKYSNWRGMLEHHTLVLSVKFD